MIVVSTQQRRRYIQDETSPGTKLNTGHSEKKRFTLVDCFFLSINKYKSEKYRRSYRWVGSYLLCGRHTLWGVMWPITGP